MENFMRFKISNKKSINILLNSSASSEASFTESIYVEIIFHEILF